MPKGNSRYDTEHLRNISSYQRQIDEIFKAADEEAARIVKASKAEYDPDKPFSFDDYPSVRKRVDKMTADLSSRVERTIVNGIKAQWELSNRKNDDLVETVTGLKADDFPSDQRRRWFATNESARDAFIKRERAGMDLSTEVWKRETELSADLSLKDFHDRLERGMTEGMSADEMSRELRDYLKHPTKLFRRVQDERGVLTISRNAAVFHPGRGVYRSSYMNARRLAATETNMAYRSADHERWKNLDFVVGIEIGTSNNHTTKTSSGKTVELRDICDELAGRYPKDFKFVGWHPHCRCIATTILKTEEEMAADTERILNGEEPLPAKDSENYEGSVSEKFDRWVMSNLKRIEEARNKGTLPYFLKDNEEYLNKVIPPTLRHLYESTSNYQYTDPELKAREAEMNAKLKQLFEDNDYGMEINPDDLESILEKGFLNQFETGKSGGYIKRNPVTSGDIETDNPRLVASHRMFDNTQANSGNFVNNEYIGEQFSRHEYEKYGHLIDSNIARSYKNTNIGYGGPNHIQVRFDKEKVKATWTFSDSLCAHDGNREYYQPSLPTDPRIESFNRKFFTYLVRKYGYTNTIDNFLNDTDNLTAIKNKAMLGYIEMQYHGEVAIDCVKSMTFGENPENLSNIGEDLLRKLDKKGVELWYMDNGKAKRYKPKPKP